MIKPYYEKDGITIYCGDCREIFTELPKVDLVLTDPPYELTGLSGGGFAGNSIYHNDTLQAMSSFEPEPFLRLVKGVTIVACCSRNLILAYQNWAKSNGYISDVHVWYKPNAIPFCSNTFKADLEYVIVLTLKGRTFNKGLHQSCYSKVFQHNLIPSNGNKFHPTEKPIGLMLKYAQILSRQGEIILDPYCGGGYNLDSSQVT